jgi:hypothetical protein
MKLKAEALAEMPPAMELLAKSVYQEEEIIKTAGFISFIKHERLTGLERTEEMAANRDKNK